MNASLALALSEILGPKGWLTGSDAIASSRDWLNRYGMTPLGVARPATTDEVQSVVRLCGAAGVPLTPQGGNTSLCGAAVTGTEGGVILSLARMTAIGTPDTMANSIEVEAGAILANLHSVLEPHGLIFPMHLGAEGSAQIGGLIATNAGGSHAFRYGTMQDLILGLEVVLPDGEVWSAMRSVQKDNSGYQLKKLFCGSEGTLGVVTRAVLRTYPETRSRATALLALPDAHAMVAFGAKIRSEASEFISGLEFMSETGVALALQHISDLVFPLENRAPSYVLVELASTSPRVPLEEILEDMLAEGFESGTVIDGVVALNENQRAQMWRLREEQPEGQRLEGPQIKHDISVPPGQMAEFIAAGDALCRRLLPGVRINPFGHLADGNVHYNLSPPIGSADFSGVTEAIVQEVSALAENLGGSFAAEHGLGRSKAATADRLRSSVERRLMASIKSAIDPDGLLNPGVLFTGHS